jgi:hypothetical protein
MREGPIDFREVLVGEVVHPLTLVVPVLALPHIGPFDAGREALG